MAYCTESKSGSTMFLQGLCQAATTEVLAMHLAHYIIQLLSPKLERVRNASGPCQNGRDITAETSYGRLIGTESAPEKFRRPEKLRPSLRLCATKSKDVTRKPEKLKTLTEAVERYNVARLINPDPIAVSYDAEGLVGDGFPPDAIDSDEDLHGLRIIYFTCYYQNYGVLILKIYNKYS